jgi:hypothetical protein
LRMMPEISLVGVLVVAGLLSVVLFPLGALTLLRGGKRPAAELADA